ncbi:hypothetical protein PAAG_03227 [Paracoccidioides lutzii Pb01]|uniref:Uncharacterized protein n=1 Tax=Paracoccidioides lutzii (strain ATCC MYA-826 / Pb01) TaxID=502779 RepID=C1GXU4_PARBA|nr:hypothetical protein PAAG_03227 [Paracoccidioides lutzii Pb01]EEH41664.2 hypothetical protein PAAG_03227 [Paracoccidioides lutzii Pb01]
MSSTPESANKKRGRPKKVVTVAAPNKSSAGTAAAASTTTNAVIKRSSPTYTNEPNPATTTTTRIPRKPSTKANPAPVSEINQTTTAPIREKSRVTKSCPTPLKSTKSPSTTSTSNPPSQLSIKFQTPSTQLNPHSATAAIREKQKWDRKQQVGVGAGPTVQADGEISSRAKSAMVENTVIGQGNQGVQRPQPETIPLKPFVDDAAAQGSNILNALAASNSKSAAAAEDKFNRIAGSTGSSSAAATNMAPPVRKFSASPSQQSSSLPPIKPPAKRASPLSAQRLSSQRLEPAQAQAESAKPQDIRQTKQYKILARRWTSAMVALPILIYTSYELYQRVFANKAPRSLPGTNHFPPVNENSRSPSPSPITPSSASTTET